MPNKKYERGRAWEYDLISQLRKQGLISTRSAGSHGLWDVTSVNDKVVYLIQAKYTEKSFEECMKDNKRELDAFRELRVPKSVHKILWIKRSLGKGKGSEYKWLKL